MNPITEGPLSLIQFIADDLGVTELQAIEIYSMREHIRILASSRAFRDICLRRFNYHLEQLCNPKDMPENWLACCRGQAQEAHDMPGTLMSLYEGLANADERHKEFIAHLEAQAKLKEEQDRGSA